MPGSNSRWLSWLANGLSVIALVLALVIVVEGAQNRSLQDKVTAGRTALTKAQALANLDNNLVQLLAKTAAEKKDAALQDLLARNGVTFRMNSDGAPAAPSAAAPAGQGGAKP